MSTVISAEKLHLAYGTRPLLDHVDFRIERGERVCLLGRNGEGKSSLLRLITGESAADDGDLWVADGARIAVLPQELPEKRDKTAYQTVAEAFPETADLLSRFEALSMSGESSEAHLNELQRVQEQLEVLDGWRLDQRIRQVLEQYEVDPEARLPELSGGWQRRVLLAKALVSEPDLLLLDEPTNHLDVPAIRWLEQTLSQFGGAVLFVSHDRAFIRTMATRILELDRGHLTSWPGNYDKYLELKEKALEEEDRQNALFDKRLAQEEAWIRQGIKARRTRNQGRVRALKAMREEHRQRRDVQGTTRMTIEAAEKSGKLVVEAKQAQVSFADRPVLSDVNLLLLRGDKVGVIGENGSGKTTLVRLLLGDLEPSAGSVRQGTKLEVAYFDQLRAELDPDKTALDNLSEGREYIEVAGQKKHVMGYLSEFLFTPDRARTQVRVLSGGERARLLLAKLFSKPANVLVLDEPTNDLDVPTLELLESRLVDFTGTVILISHDREFLDNVVGSVLYLDGEGQVDDFVGGYSDWRRQGGEFPSEKPTAVPASVKTPASPQPTEPAQQQKPRKKLSYKLQRELDQMPKRIESLEEEVASLTETVADPGFYQSDQETVESTLARLNERESELEAAIERWMELEEEGEASTR